MRVGIVGCGLIGGKRAKSITACGHSVVATADAVPERAAALAKSYPGCAVAPDWRELVTRDNVDAVVVATINDSLALITLLSLGTAAAAFAQDAPKPPSSSGGTMINLNSATVPQLETLPGIGRSTAERIVEYRQKSGGFKKIEDLMNVQGIGEKSFLKLKPLVTVGAARAERSGQ